MNNSLIQKAVELHKRGEDPHAVKVEIARGELEGGLSEYVRLLAGKDACPTCAAHNGKVLRRADALAMMLIPHRDCTYGKPKEPYGWCRCMYIAVRPPKPETPA